MARKRRPDQVPKGHSKNLETITRAAKEGALGLAQCKLVATGEFVTVLTAFSWGDGEVIMTPLAQLFDGNPYEMLEPPTIQQEAA